MKYLRQLSYKEKRFILAYGTEGYVARLNGSIGTIALNGTPAEGGLSWWEHMAEQTTYLIVRKQVRDRKMEKLRFPQSPARACPQ
jgi:hypothetical protein